MDDRHTSDESKAEGHARTAPDTATGTRTGHLRLGPWPFDADDGFCADLDAPAGERGIVVRAGWHMSGMGTSGPGAASSGPPAGSPEANRNIPGTVARAISDAVDGERARAAQADITIRTELDPHASGLPASQVGAILSGLLARAVDACLGAAARGDAPLDGDEIVVVARLDAGWLLLHVIDGAAAPAGCVTDTMGLGASAPGASDGGSILSNATSTARSIGGTLELRNVPFGPGTLATARIPLAALAAAG